MRTFLLGFLVASLLWWAAIWVMPRLYMGPTFSKLNMTRQEVIKVLREGKHIHAWYSKLPWRQQLMRAGGGEQFDLYWVRTYDAAIGYLRTCP